MKVKIDTKEKFHVITFKEDELHANMTEELSELLVPFKQKNPANVILNMLEVYRIADTVASNLASIQHSFYESNCSFVFCNLQPEVEALLEEKELLEFMNITPTESEAWDIVQMEEIERDLM